MTNKKNYIVTLHSHDDLEQFYKEMETKGGTSFVPERKVQCHFRGDFDELTSRNTEYLLTEEEAEVLRQDPRVRAVELPFWERGLELSHAIKQSGNFETYPVNGGTNDKNWGLLRCINGAPITINGIGWGYDGTSQASATLTTSEGKGLPDVVILDGHIDPAHPEFQKNADATGGTRVNQINWCTVYSNTSGTYSYTPYVDSNNTSLTENNNHGMHVAGTTSGNTQGWYRSTAGKIYNINPYSTNTNTFVLNGVTYPVYANTWLLIKGFHANKPKPTPTIVNASLQVSRTILLSSIRTITYRGVTSTVPQTSSTDTINYLKNYKFNFGPYNSTSSYVIIPQRDTATDSAIEDAISAGIVVVGAAGNYGFYIDVEGGPDYNNFITLSTGENVYYNRGSSPGSAGKITSVTKSGKTTQVDNRVICVGSIDSTVSTRKAEYSNCGPRVDVYAPGTNIMSSVHNGVGSQWGTFPDPRNNTYKLTFYDGTSMASPQVTGVLCNAATSAKKGFNQANARNYITTYASLNQITSSPDLRYDIQGSPNSLLFYYFKRTKKTPPAVTINSTEVTQFNSNLLTSNFSAYTKQDTIPFTGLAYPRQSVSL